MNRIVTITFLVLLVVLISLLDAANGLGYSYKIVPEEDDIFTPCSGEEDKFIDKFFDLSGITFTRVDDENIIVDGALTWTHEADIEQRIKLTIEVEKEKNGQWVPTPMTIARENFCDRMFAKTEYWHEFVKDFTGDQRICPPPPGTKYILENIAGNKVIHDIPNGNMEGRYRVIFRFKSEQTDMCCEALGNVYKMKR